jgi:hypothetical protein
MRFTYLSRIDAYYWHDSMLFSDESRRAFANLLQPHRSWFMTELALNPLWSVPTIDD